jgi:predicted ribosome quality control (RQC) complex YloA/Tae2 family protein
MTSRVAGCDVKLWPALEPLMPVEYDLHVLLDFIKSLQDGALTPQIFGAKDWRGANQAVLDMWCQVRKKRGMKHRRTDAARERLSIRLDQLQHQRKLSDRADEVEKLALDMLRRANDEDSAGNAHAFITQWQDEHPDWAEQVTAERSVYDNAQELVHYAQRLRRGKDKLDALVAKAEHELAMAERRPAVKKKADPVKSQQARLDKHGVKYLRFVSSDKLHILCGVNDVSNDGLLRVFSGGKHLWLHARDYPGSHVIVLSDGRDAIPRRTIEEAALIAAYYSQGKKEAKLDVSYLPVKYVKRVKGGKPGQVLKTRESVINVRPDRFVEIQEKIRYSDG